LALALCEMEAREGREEWPGVAVAERRGGVTVMPAPVEEAPAAAAAAAAAVCVRLCAPGVPTSVREREAPPVDVAELADLLLSERAWPAEKPGPPRKGE
jgi:hypothetical protein